MFCEIKHCISVFLKFSGKTVQKKELFLMLLKFF